MKNVFPYGVRRPGPLGSDRRNDPINNYAVGPYDKPKLETGGLRSYPKQDIPDVSKEYRQLPVKRRMRA